MANRKRKEKPLVVEVIQDSPAPLGDTIEPSFSPIIEADAPTLNTQETPEPNETSTLINAVIDKMREVLKEAPVMYGNNYTIAEIESFRMKESEWRCKLLLLTK